MGQSENDKPVPHTLTRISDATLREFMGYHMKRAFNVVQADLTQTLKPYGLRMLTYTALVLIADNPGLSPSQLAAAMDVERPNLVVIVDQLEQRELIVRERVPGDRRTYALKVTLLGQQLYEKAVAADKASEERILKDIPQDTRDTVIAALQMIQTWHSRG